VRRRGDQSQTCDGDDEDQEVAHGFSVARPYH